MSEKALALKSESILVNAMVLLLQYQQVDRKSFEIHNSVDIISKP